MRGPSDPTEEARPALAELVREMRRLRRRAGVSQRVLATRMGYAREYVTMAERGARLVDLAVQPGDSPYTTATAMSALASTLVRLSDGEAAEEYARQAVALYDAPGVEDSRFEDRGNATLNLAASLVVRRRPDPEEAVRLGIQAIAVQQAQRTETVRQRAVELLLLLGDWHAAPAVKDYADRLRDYQLPASSS